jgi:hypothetical protein
MISPPSGLPVLSSHTQTAVAATVNATRKASTSRVYVLTSYAARETAARPREGARELGEDGEVGVKPDPLVPRTRRGSSDHSCSSRPNSRSTEARRLWACQSAGRACPV